MKHTPGPWKPDQYNLSVWAKALKVCDIRGWGHLTGVGGMHLREKQAEAIQAANARLIAAAPDLLAACEAISELNSWDLGLPPDPQLPERGLKAWRMVRDAIAKATAHTSERAKNASDQQNKSEKPK